MAWPGLVLITGGGTGGHVFPGIAAAAALRELGADVHWLGTRRGLEARLVPGAGIPLSFLRASGLRGKQWWQRLLAPVQLTVSIFQAMLLILRLRPVCVLGTGGYVAAPGGLAAWLLRCPLVIHEQNAVAGSTNRLLARFAGRVLCAFPDVLTQYPQRREVGNPVRAAIAAIAAPQARLAPRQGVLRLLVLGGSQGSVAINEVVSSALAQLPSAERPEVWHQCGQHDHKACLSRYQQSGVVARVEPFVTDMAAAYAWADLVLCRAGALTVAEVAAAGVAALLVPLPHAIDDHQRRNAAWLSDRQAALQIDQADLSPDRLAAVLTGFSADRAALLAIAERARAMARLDAAAAVAVACREVADG